MKRFNLSTWLFFLIPSIAGLLFFLIPVRFSEGWQVPIAKFSGLLGTVLEPITPFAMMSIMVIAAIGSIVFMFIPEIEGRRTFAEGLFKVTPFWLVTRIVGAIFGVMVIFKLGPEALWNENTGGLLLAPDGLISLLFTVFLLAGLFLPLLLNYGLLEFFGTMMVKVMRPLFKLPGRSAVDALASWFGDGTIGVLLTNKQYEEGFYTKKEAAVIGTNFSVVSITFSIVIIQTVGLEEYYLPFYGTVLLTGVILAMVMPRIYPLAGKKQEYIDGTPYTGNEELLPEGYNVVNYGLEKALEKAENNRKNGSFLKDGMKNVVDLWIGVTPVIMAFGTIALILAEFTSVFTILGKPFEPILALLGVPEAQEAAQLMVVGFADMFLPALLAEGLITTPMTLFIVATISVIQLIYMSEVGGVLLGTKIPITFTDLIVIFLLRTLIALPIVVLVANLLF